jgi:phytoene dehydrogenase-like protein
MKPRVFDAAIIGGGHNGLVCAAYLAARGLATCVLERRAVLGGAAVTEEFHPGFRNSTASYTVSLLDPAVIRDLRLAEHGLGRAPSAVLELLPLPDAAYLKVGGFARGDAGRGWRASRPRRAAAAAYYAMLDRVADVHARDPARHAAERRSGRRDLATLVDIVKLSRRFRGLDLERDATWWTSSPRAPARSSIAGSSRNPIRAAFGFDAVVGKFPEPLCVPAPRTSSCTTCSARVERHSAASGGHARGGMGAITQAMARECEARRRHAAHGRPPVARVLVEAAVGRAE